MSELETCKRLIEEARRCLENGDKECVLRLIEDLIKNQCHDGRLIGVEVADKVRDLVHELWLRSNDECRCESLRTLKDLVTKGWISAAARTPYQYLDKLLAKCGIEWESRARSNIVKQLEDLLRERFGWSEVRMCEEMWQFVGVNTEAFRKYGIEPCIWFKGLEELSDLRRPYWLGLARSDLAVRELGDGIELELKTTNSISAVFFLTLLGTIRTPSLLVKWKKKAPAAKYVSETINLSYYVYLGINEWPWPIKLSVDELERILDGFSDEELAEFIAGMIDGDGSVQYEGTVYVRITACKNCPKRVIDILKEIIARRFGITGSINSERTADVLKFYGENAVRLLRRIVKYVHHPLRRLRIELILALHDGRISREAFGKLYEMTEYEYGGPDVKRNNALAATARAAPQTHTHGAYSFQKKISLDG